MSEIINNSNYRIKEVEEGCMGDPLRGNFRRLISKYLVENNNGKEIEKDLFNFSMDDPFFEKFFQNANPEMVYDVLENVSEIHQTAELALKILKLRLQNNENDQIVNDFKFKGTDYHSRNRWSNFKAFLNMLCLLERAKQLGFNLSVHFNDRLELFKFLIAKEKQKEKTFE